MDKKNNWKSSHWIATRRIHFNKDLRYRPTPKTERLLCKVADHTTISNNFHLMEEAYSCLLANLYHATVMDSPLVYSRNSNAYTIERTRYGYEFYTYKMIIRLVDAMYDLGLVLGVKGRKKSSGQCKPSKMWATGELTDLLRSPGGAVFIKRNNEVLYLKDADKRLQAYRDNTLTNQMRSQIQGFNEMLGSLNITFKFDYASLSDKPVSRVNKFHKLVSLISCNQVEIVSPDSSQLCHHETVLYHTDMPIHTKYYIILDHDAFLLNKYRYIQPIMAVKSAVNYMRRVFNVDWCHGGRFYHAPHLTIPSACRKSMVINGEPTVELDYSGLHIRMLYHRLGIDYRGECYVYEKANTANKVERERTKLASLIVINSSDRKTAIKALHDQCRRKDIHYPIGEFGRYGALVDRFGVHHEPIKEFLLTGQGLELQCLDSTIMASILDRMTRQAIPALPVHDSVICPAQYEGFLRQVMVEEYEKVMGFKPVIG